jgi:hypothetical protein
VHRANDDENLPLTISPAPVMKRLPAPPLPAVRLRYADRLPSQKQPWLHWPGMAMVALGIITALGVFLRFYHLTFPALWNDETLVFWRVCGTYGQMLVPLRTDGFPPLHYSLYWIVGHPIPTDAYVNQRILGGVVAIAAVALVIAAVIGAIVAVVRKQTNARLALLAGAGLMCTSTLIALAIIINSSSTAALLPARWSPGQHVFWLNPWAMRAIPAIFGALTVPAVYFLARQMLPRGTSLVAALFTACSAFMLFYSRDGKMYSDSWLFVTLNLGCLLWWFRTNRSTAWLCWVAAGCAMVGLQATALTIPGVSILLVLTQRSLRWKKFLLFLAGLAVIYAGPAGYYSKFNIWTERVEQVGWSTSGLGWVGGFFNGDRTGVEHYQYATSAFLMGYEYPRDDYVEKDANSPIADELVTGPETAFAEIVIILAAALLPWPLFLRPRRDLDPPPESAWRVYFWITGVILTISYGLYCHSVRGFVSPWRWWHEVREALDWSGFALLGTIAGTFVVCTAIDRRRWPALIRFFQFSLVTVALFGICLAMYRVLAPDAAEAFFQYKPWESIWTPRYLGTIWPMCGVGVAALLMRLPTRPVRIACIVFIMAVNIGMFSLRMTLGTEPPIDIQAHDEWLAQDIGGKPSKVHTFDFIAHGGIAVAESALDVRDEKVTAGRYYLVNDSRGTIPNDPRHRPLSPDVFERSLSYFEQAGFGFNLRQDYNWWEFRHDIASSPQLERAIVWTRIGPHDQGRHRATRPTNIDNDYILQSAQSLGYDPLRKLFPPGWKLSSEKIYTVRNPWDWRTFAFWIRREYAKTTPISARHK